MKTHLLGPFIPLLLIAALASAAPLPPDDPGTDAERVRVSGICKYLGQQPDGVHVTIQSVKMGTRIIDVTFVFPPALEAYAKASDRSVVVAMGWKFKSAGYDEPMRGATLQRVE